VGSISRRPIGDCKKPSIEGTGRSNQLPYVGEGASRKTAVELPNEEFDGVQGDRGRGIGDDLDDTPPRAARGSNGEVFRGVPYGAPVIGEGSPLSGPPRPEDLAFAPNVRYTCGKRTRKLTSGASEMGQNLPPRPSFSFGCAGTWCNVQS
jgi:hypothetical protein